jgi:hypothetical protein
VRECLDVLSRADEERSREDCPVVGEWAEGAEDGFFTGVDCR